MYYPIVARQRLGKYVSAATNTHATIEEFLDSFLMRFMSYQRKVRVSVCVSLVSLLVNGSVNTFPRQQIHTAIEELLVSFSMRSVFYQRNVGDFFCPELLVNAMNL
jgi:hypothetical protein